MQVTHVGHVKQVSDTQLGFEGSKQVFVSRLRGHRHFDTCDHLGLHLGHYEATIATTRMVAEPP